MSVPYCYLLSHTVTCFYLLLPAVTHCYSPLPTVIWCYLLLPAVTYCYLLLPAVTYRYLLSHTVTCCYLLLPTVTYYYLLLQMLPRRLNKILIVRKKSRKRKESDNMLSVNQHDRRKHFSFKFIFNVCWRRSYRNTRKSYINTFI